MRVPGTTKTGGERKGDTQVSRNMRHDRRRRRLLRQRAYGKFGKGKA